MLFTCELWVIHFAYVNLLVLKSEELINITTIMYRISYNHLEESKLF